MKCAAAPFFGSNVNDGFGEVPAVAVKILGIVLTFTVGMILGFSQDDGAVLPRPPTVSIGIFNADLNVLRVVRRDRAFGDGEAALAGFHLDAMIGDAETDSEAKSL